MMRLFPLTSYLSLLTACAITPLTNRIDVGNDPFVIGVGEGPDGNTDLFAALAGGGAFVRLTFTAAEERAPRLAPEGTRVGFLRRQAEGDATRWIVVALDLKSSVERTAPLPEFAAEPERLGWSADGTKLLLKAGGLFEMDPGSGAVPLRRIPVDALSPADPGTAEVLGAPPMGMVVECPGGGVCIAARTGEITPLGSGVRQAVRWGADSVGYFVADGSFEVRPLAGGRSRRPDWTGMPRALRSITHHPGVRSP